jgi:hypothetical protein
VFLSSKILDCLTIEPEVNLIPHTSRSVCMINSRRGIEAMKINVLSNRLGRCISFLNHLIVHIK